MKVAVLIGSASDTGTMVTVAIDRAVNAAFPVVEMPANADTGLARQLDEQRREMAGA